MQINNTTLEIVRGSILHQDVAAIVNAANTGMRGGGALDGAIHRAAGPDLLAELEQVAPDGSETGECVVTQGHNLSQSHILHVAGPIWNPNRADECDELLAQSYLSCLEAADDLGLESLAFPSLSTGVYSFPLARAAAIALQTAIDFLRENPQTSLQRIVFAMFGGEEHHYFQQALKKWEKNDETNT